MFKFAALFVTCLIVAVNTSTISRNKRQTSEEEQFIKDAENQVMGFIDSIYGGHCVTDDNCMQFISHCSRDSVIQPVGECKLNWWSWIILALIVLLFLGCCVGCCFLQCCCLYKCCQAILDCLCCCCRNKGYSPANRG